MCVKNDDKEYVGPSESQTKLMAAGLMVMIVVTLCGIVSLGEIEQGVYLAMALVVIEIPLVLQLYAAYNRLQDMRRHERMLKLAAGKEVQIIN